MNPFTFGKADKNDTAGLSALLEELFSIEKDFKIDRKKQEYGLKMLLDSPETAVIFAAKNSADKIVGMCTAQLLVSTAQGAPTGLIEDMVITASCRGQKLGTKLLEMTENWCREMGATRIQLLADKTNTPALDFYEKQSWSSTRMICLRKYL